MVPNERFGTGFALAGERSKCTAMTAPSWQARILDEFVPGVSPIWLAADPDGLLQDERILAGLRERGFLLLRFEDPIAFRYAYESQFRAQGPGGDCKGLVVLVPAPAAALDPLPHDLLAKARRLAFGLAELFPNLNQAVVAALEPADLDTLYDAQALNPVGVLGKAASKDFVLRHVFGIVSDLVRTPTDLLRILLRRHYPSRRIPPMLDERFIRAIQRRFERWPLDRIVPDREAFFAFLQERWPAFLDWSADRRIAMADGDGRLAHSGPIHLPFDHEDIRVYVDNLFAEGLLRPVAHPSRGKLHKTWLNVGIRSDQRASLADRLARLLAVASDALPEPDARHEDWFRFAKVWAELAVLDQDPNLKPNAGQRQEIDALRTRMDTAFARWLGARYASLANLPPERPVMLHHIPRFLARQIDAGTEKVALVVVDGLALDQWAVMRQELARQRPGWRFREGAAFAWVPTITSVSRQAIFAGNPPLFFPESIQGTHKEKALWQRFWTDQDVPGTTYAKGLGDGPFDEVEKLAEQPNIRALGLVVDKVDRIMHGMTLGAAGMHNQVRQWAAQAHFAALLDLLLSRGFQVFLTADHGNIEATGCGRPDEGAVADLRGERVRVYPSEELRRTVAERFPDAWEWPPDGLPAGYLPLLAPGRSAFVRQGERIVAHGGVCLEELIVPFIQVERRG